MSDATTPAESELLTITEAADLLRAPVATLRYWRHRNIGPHSFRVGRHVLYRRADLSAWIDAQHRQDNTGGAQRECPTGPTVVSPRGQAAHQ